MKLGKPRSQDRVSFKVTGEKEGRGDYLVHLFLE
jgi:hypothetical protein